MRLPRMWLIQYWRKLFLAFAALVLLLPVVGMLVSDEVFWSPGDFIVAAVLMGGTWLALEAVVRLVSYRQGRIYLAATVVLVALAGWAQLAIQF